MYMVLCVDTSAFMRVGYVHLIHLNLDVECVFIYKYILLICFCVCLDICTMIYPNSIPCVASPVGEPPTLCNISDKVVYIEAIYYINLIFTSCINHGYIYIYGYVVWVMLDSLHAGIVQVKKTNRTEKNSTVLMSYGVQVGVLSALDIVRAIAASKKPSETLGSLEIWRILEMFTLWAFGPKKLGRSGRSHGHIPSLEMARSPQSQSKRIACLAR